MGFWAMLFLGVITVDQGLCLTTGSSILMLHNETKRASPRSEQGSWIGKKSNHNGVIYVNDDAYNHKLDDSYVNDGGDDNLSLGSALSINSYMRNATLNHQNQLNPFYTDLDTQHTELSSLQSDRNGHRIYRIMPYQNLPYRQLGSESNDDIIQLKKHDQLRSQLFGGDNFGGQWDGQNGGGIFNFGGGGGQWNGGGGGGGQWNGGGGGGGFGGHSGFGGGGGLSGAGGLLAVKKTAGAKALFVLIVPLILLAVFGPILASQAMIPWAMNSGGLATVSTMASGKRRRRSTMDFIRGEGGPMDPRQVAELEKRLRVFMAVQEYIATSGSEYSPEAVSASFLKCQGFMEDNNRCLQRVACEYADRKSEMNPIERRMTKMVLQNIMTNSMIPSNMKARLRKGIMFGKTHSRRCSNFFCELVDGRRTRPDQKTNL